MKFNSWKWRLAQWAEIRWWKNYLGAKEMDIYLQKKKQYWKEVLLKLHLSIDTDATVLDAGCGPAGIFIVLEKQSVKAIDPLLTQYQLQFPSLFEQYGPNIHFEAIPVESFQSEELFDQVFCFNAINHVDHIELALEKLFGVLKPGGSFCISIDVHRYLLLKKVFQWIPADILHPHQFTLGEYQEMIRRFPVVVTSQICLKPGKIFDYYAILGYKQG